LLPVPKKLPVLADQRGEDRLLAGDRRLAADQLRDLGQRAHVVVDQHLAADVDDRALGLELVA
jgi:hypothetical protein